MRNNRRGCVLPVILSIILGIIIGILFYIGIISEIAAIVLLAFVIAIVALVLLVLVAAFGKKDTEQCVCENGKCLAIGAIGTIIVSIIIFAFCLTRLIGAILLGIGGFFFFLTVIMLIGFVICLVNASCRCRERLE